MDSEAFERLMRGGETYSTLAVPKGRWIVVRLDGRGFTKYTERARLAKPFDEGFSTRMVKVAKRLMIDFGGIYAETHSDEISVLLPENFDLFGRRLEKLVSVSAGMASASFGECFDARVWTGCGLGSVIDYFSWRQADAVTNGLSSWAYWTLRQKTGHSAAMATSILLRKGDAERHEILLECGIDFNKTPMWTRRGIGVAWRHTLRDGFNPVTQEATQVWRTVFEERRELPVREEYRDWLRGYLEEELRWESDANSTKEKS